MGMVVSWICVLCIFIIVANLLRWMYSVVFRETASVRENRASKNEKQKMYTQPVYRYQYGAPEGRIPYRDLSERYAASYSSYENYHRRKRKTG